MSTHIRGQIDILREIDDLSDRMERMDLPWNAREGRLYERMDSAIEEYRDYLERIVGAEEERREAEREAARKAPAKKPQASKSDARPKSSGTSKKKTTGTSSKKAPAKQEARMSRGEVRDAIESMPARSRRAMAVDSGRVAGTVFSDRPYPSQMDAYVRSPGRYDMVGVDCPRGTPATASRRGNSRRC